MLTVSQKMKYIGDKYFKNRSYEFEFELEDEDRETLSKATGEELYKLVENLVEGENGNIETAKYECGLVDGYKEAIVDLVNHFRDIETCDDILEKKYCYTAETLANMLERLLK